MYKINILSQILLYSAYKIHMNSDSPFIFNSSSSQQLFGKTIPRNTIQASIDRNFSTYANDSFLRRHGKNGSYSYQISANGIDFVQAEIRRKESPIAYYAAHPEFFEEICSLNTIFLTEKEQSIQDYWEPLKIDRSDIKTIEAIESVENAIRAIEGDNGFASSFPKERQGIIQTLKDGVDWLKNKSPTKSQLKSLILSPLNWILSTFPQTVLSEFVKKAVAKIVEAFFG